MDPRWQHPFTCVIAGPTSCGKTQWVMNFLNNVSEMVYPPVSHIVYSYGEWQPSYATLPAHVNLQEGMSNIPEYAQEPCLLIIDDQMDEVDKNVMRLFTKGSHHRNISVIYIVQNLFSQNRDYRTISLNAHYLVIFKNPRDASQIAHLAKQMYPGQSRYVQEAFTLATRKPYGYLLLDLKQSTPDALRLRSRIFPGEENEVYIQKNSI